MINTTGEVITCQCPNCGHVHKISEREISIYQGMVVALWRVFKWCQEIQRHEFEMNEIRDLIGKIEYARFGDWKKFGGLVYQPEEKGKGHYGINVERCDSFFKGEYKIPLQIWKNPITKELRAGEYKTIKEVPQLSALLNDDKSYIARYRMPTQQTIL